MIRSGRICNASLHESRMSGLICKPRCKALFSAKLRRPRHNNDALIVVIKQNFMVGES
jgi:hypothetical protein